ncbi:peptidase inhibitor family I36 protein [Streptomyces sp. NPDC055681]
MKLAKFFAAAAVAGMSIAGLAAPASATEHNGVCETGEFCLWYNPNYANGIWDMYYADLNLNDNYFIGNSSQRVGNNSASAKNRDSLRWYVYFGTNKTGTSGWYDSGEVNSQMTNFRNQIESASY